MIDAHCHLDDFENGTTMATAATEAGVKFLLTCSTCVESCRKNIEIAQLCPTVYAAVGLGYEGEVQTELETFMRQERVVAIGECGLDIQHTNIELFEYHIQLAEKYSLPLVVHCREMFAEVYARVEKRNVIGQMHCFTGSCEWMKKFVDLGWYISFSGIVTFKNSADLREVVRQTPQERILVETDSPYLAPEPIRGTRNEPKNAMIVTETIALLRGQTVEEVGYFTLENAKRLFRI